MSFYWSRHIENDRRFQSRRKHVFVQCFDAEFTWYSRYKERAVYITMIYHIKTRFTLTWVNNDNYQSSNVLKDDEKMKKVKSNDQVKKYTDVKMINEFDEKTSFFINEKIDLKTWKLNKNDDENNMNIIEIFDW
jgi:hypothetical protein